MNLQAAQQANSDAWLAALVRGERTPSAQQLAFLHEVRDRCLLEQHEIDTDRVNMTAGAEPMRRMIQGLPGAGKSELIKWTRSFFEECMGWQHGVQFVCVASQNTMAALIGGFTNHSFGNIPRNDQQRAAWRESQWRTPEACALFDRYQAMPLPSLSLRACMFMRVCAPS